MSSSECPLMRKTGAWAGVLPRWPNGVRRLREVQLAYYEAVKNHTRDFLANITAEELDREIVMGNVPEPRPVAVCMGQMVWDTVAHGGQIAYLRGFYRGMGWFR